MATLSWLMLFAGALLYAASAVMFFVDATRKGGPRGPLASTPAAPRPTAASRFGLAPTLLAAAAVLHLGYITVASFVAHTCPVGSVHFILSVVAIAAAGAFTLARVTRRGLANIDALGVVVAPFGLAFLLGTSAIACNAPATNEPTGRVALPETEKSAPPFVVMAKGTLAGSTLSA